MRKSWNVVISIDPEAETPIFLQVARAISEAIQAGKLAAGESLPGTRAMAGILGIHRKTVVAAYDELMAQGWIQTEPSRGTFVSTAMPELSAQEQEAQTGLPEYPDYSFQSVNLVMPYQPQPKGTLTFNDGTPDPRLLPADVLIRAYRKALLNQQDTLEYGDPRGRQSLRVEVADMLNKGRGLSCKAEEVLITRGSQMALYLAAQALIRPGDIVVIEELSYPPAWQAFEQAGAEIVPLPLDQDGLLIEALEALSRKKRIRAIYLTPHHQYPTTVTLRACRRLRLLELAREKGFVIIEDDYDHEYHYVGHPVLPLASIDHTGHVLYVGSLSKLLAPGLRIGYVVGPKALIDSMAALRTLIDRQGDPVLEEAVAALMMEGELKRHAKKARKEYQLRRDFLVKQLESLYERVSFTVPAGGLALWVHFPRHKDVQKLQEKAQENGIHFSSAVRFSYAKDCSPAARLGFAALSLGELEQGSEWLKQAL